MGKLLRRIHHLVHRRRLESELEEEMAAHREMMPPERRGAFGSSLRFRDESRDLWGWLWIDHLRQDLLYAVRGFARERRFTFSALLAITLAVGAATAVFSGPGFSPYLPLTLAAASSSLPASPRSSAIAERSACPIHETNRRCLAMGTNLFVGKQTRL